MSFKEYINRAKLAPEEGDIIEIMDVRSRVFSNALVNAQREIPSVCCTYNADITAFWQEYEKLKKSCGYSLPFNTLMIKLLVEGLKIAPRLNAHIEYDHHSTSGRLIIKKHINVTVPFCTEDGTTIQVKAQHLEDKNLAEISAQLEELKYRLSKTGTDHAYFDVAAQRMAGYVAKRKVSTTFAQFISAYFGKNKISKFSKLFRKKKHSGGQKKKYEGLRADDFTEGTVCFTNWGTLYDRLDVNVTYITPMYPSVFLLAAGRVKDETYAFKDDDGKVDIGTKKVLPLTLIFDHKIGGATDIMPFIRKMDEVFENPEIIHSW
ncbi:MAG: 2-oxo acid dehydrogenase subunit E2 [Clostridia bacterium]|nr:2-oxo acid dehydrogenase subunit E2 [Clostridia bacterium]